MRPMKIEIDLPSSSDNSNPDAFLHIAMNAR